MGKNEHSADETLGHWQAELKPQDRIQFADGRVYSVTEVVTDTEIRIRKLRWWKLLWFRLRRHAWHWSHLLSGTSSHSRHQDGQRSIS